MRLRVSPTERSNPSFARPLQRAWSIQVAANKHHTPVAGGHGTAQRKKPYQPPFQAANHTAGNTHEAALFQAAIISYLLLLPLTIVLVQNRRASGPYRSYAL